MDFSDPTNITGAYEAFLLVNITSSEIPAAYGTLVHTAILNHYLQNTQSGWPEGQLVKVNWIDHPFPLNKKLQSAQTTISGTNVAFMMALAWLMISDSLI